jgi:hypothetical protein
VDALGVRWTSNSVTVTVANDTTRPAVTINKAATQADPTSSAPINFTAVFSEAVSGFTNADVAIGGTAGGTKTVSVSGSGSTYNVAVSGMTSSGTVVASILAGVAQDAAGNTNTASSSTDNSVQFNLPDTTAPAPPPIPDLAAASDSGVSSTDNLTNDNTPTFTGTAEAGSTVKIFSDGIQVGSGSATGGAYSITTSTLSGGTHSITATATDAANNASAPSGGLSVTIDTTAPAVSIKQAATQPDPTSTSPINFTAVFSEAVSGFSGSDVAIGGTATGTKTVTVSGGPSTYTVAVSGMTSSGTVSATVAAGVAQDAAGNTNSASTSSDNSVQFNLPDTTRPTVTINQAATQADPTSSAPINFTAVFSEAVSGFTDADVAISGTALGTKTVTVSGGPSTYTVAVSGMTSSGTVSASIAAGLAQDAAGNTNTASSSTDNTVQFNLPDTTAPTVTINQAATQADPTSTSPVNFTAVFSEAVSGFSGADVTVGGTAGGTKTVTVSGGPSTYSVAVSGMTSSGTVVATVAAGVAQDAAGNTNSASTSSDNSVQFNLPDTTAPTVSITSPASGATVSGAIPVSADASDNIGVAGVRFFVDSVEIGFEDTIAPYLFSWNTITVADGSHTLTVVARDAAGNATTSAGVTVAVANGGAAVTRFEENNPAIIFNNSTSATSSAQSFDWRSYGKEIAAFSGETAAISNVPGATATINFTGKAVNWIGLRCNVCGIATVSIDGGAPVTVDTAGPTAPGAGGFKSETVFTASELPAGTHTLTITVTGTSTSSDTYIVVDAFDVAGPSASPTAVENLFAGSENWGMRRSGFQVADDIGKQIKGYASATSVNKGESITFHVTVNPVPQQYTMDVYRMGWYQGLGGRLMMPRIGPLSGVSQPECPVDVNTSTNTGLIECNWTAGYTLTVPTTWTSGVYMVQLTNAQGYQNHIPFVVRDDARRADILYQQSVTTYQAYNNYPDDGATGKSIYDFNSRGPTTVSGAPRAVKVSWNRPYKGEGSGEYFSWEYYMVRWLERSGYDVKYSTNLDTHQNSARLLDSKAFLSIGHDEYWSRTMYDGVERARDAGVSLGFFGADAVFWQVRFEPSLVNGAADRVMVAYKNGAIDPVASDPERRPTTTVLWRDPILNRPEQQLIGVQFTSQLPDNANAPYVVTNSSSWVYQGTGLVDGDSIPGIVGYEADSSMPGVPLPTAAIDPATGQSTYQVLSQSPFHDNVGAEHIANSSIYQAPSGAWVFGAGTNSWSWGLDLPGVVHPHIQRITANVLNRFLGLPLQP